VRAGATGADVGEKLFGRQRSRCFGERAPDVDPGMVVGASDSSPAVRLDVDERRQVELLRAGAVPRFPNREQLRETTPVARGQRRLDGIEGVCERGGDPARMEVLRARL